MNGYVVKEGAYRIVKEDGKYVTFNGFGDCKTMTPSEWPSLEDAMKYGRSIGLKMFESEKKVYWILSGEGERGTWKRKVATERGIKSILTRERCGGERWARAVCDFYETRYGEICGIDAENGECVTVTPEAADDIAK